MKQQTKTSRRHWREDMHRELVRRLYIRETGNQLRPRSKNDYIKYDEWLRSKIGGNAANAQSAGGK